MRRDEVKGWLGSRMVWDGRSQSHLCGYRTGVRQRNPGLPSYKLSPAPATHFVSEVRCVGLEISAYTWCDLVESFGSLFSVVAGPPVQADLFRSRFHSHRSRQVSHDHQRHLGRQTRPRPQEFGSQDRVSGKKHSLKPRPPKPKESVLALETSLFFSTSPIQKQANSTCWAWPIQCRSTRFPRQNLWIHQQQSNTQHSVMTI